MTQKKEITDLFKKADECEDYIFDLEDEDSENPDLDGAIEDAEQVLREIIKLDPENVEGLIRLGEHFMNHTLDPGSEPLKCFEQAYKLDPKNKKLPELIKEAKKITNK